MPYAAIITWFLIRKFYTNAVAKDIAHKIAKYVWWSRQSDIWEDAIEKMLKKPHYKPKRRTFQEGKVNTSVFDLM